MLTPGPRTTSTSSAMASRAMASPISRRRSGSQVAAVLDAVGKQVAAWASNAIDPVGTACAAPRAGRRPSAATADRDEEWRRSSTRSHPSAASPSPRGSFRRGSASRSRRRSQRGTTASRDRSGVMPSIVVAPHSRPGPVGSPRPCAGPAPAPPNGWRLPPAAARPRRRPTKGRDGGSNRPVVPNGRSTTAENDSPSTRHAIDTGPCGASSEALQKVIESSGRGATITRR